MSEVNSPERRIHKVYVTSNTEYHVRKDVCIAVRDRRTGQWLEGHLALTRKLEGAVTYKSSGLCPRLGTPQAGDRIYFRTGERDLVTSKLESIVRPSKSIVQNYAR